MKIIMLRGLPASGKTTWAKEQVLKGNFIRISKKSIKKSIMLNTHSRKREKDILKIRSQLIESGIKNGYNVIVDDMNLEPKHEKVLRALADELGAEFVINDSFLETPVEECIRRDLKRSNSVGASVIYNLFEQWVNPSFEQQLGEDWEKRRCVIFDIDGTLAHNLSGRGIYEHNKVMNDTPDPLVSIIADSLYETFMTYLDIIIITGRSDDCEKETRAWLDKNMIPYKELYMRKTGDERDDTVVKEEIYKKHIEPNWCVLGVFDDRPKVCRKWRELGLKVCQVGNPYIEF